MFRRIIAAAFLLLLVMNISSCKKDAGEGGTATIKGRLIKHDFDVLWQNGPVVYPVSDEDVYIIYGTGNSTYDDNFKTSYDGTYQFKYLQKGHYRLFAYSKDSTGAYNGNYNASSPKIPVFVDVEITSNGQTVNAPDIIIVDNKQ